MTTEQQMSYEPQVGDKVRFLFDTHEFGYPECRAKAGDVGTVDIATEDYFRVFVAKPGESSAAYIPMHIHGTQRIPHDLMRIECISAVPTPCSNHVDVDAVMRKCGDKPSCHDVELKVHTVRNMCREIRRYRLEEKMRKEDGEG